MVDAGLLSILDKLLRGGNILYRHYKKNPVVYLSGALESGLDVAFRIIGLFEAHNVKRTQIYQLLGKQFSGITPAIDAEKLQACLSGDLIKTVSDLFAVRQAWVQGEDVPIYSPLIHYNNFEGFVDFVRQLMERNQDNHCFLFAYKSNKSSDDLYIDFPDISVVFGEQVAEVGDKSIYRYYPIYGPLPWSDSESRHQLSAFFHVADNTLHLVIKGYSVSPNLVDKLGGGEIIPGMVKCKGLWHPDDYGYPRGHTIGRLKLEDWKGSLKYLRDNELLFLRNKDYDLRT